jgi:hypothetical protein
MFSKGLASDYEAVYERWVNEGSEQRDRKS